METVKIGPENWVESLPMLLIGYCDGTAQGKKLANQELKNMARIADMAHPLYEALQLARGRMDENTAEWITQIIDDTLNRIKMKSIVIPSPHLKPNWRVSDCCSSRVSTIPACFGDPEITICTKCNTFCNVQMLPVFEEISRGTYRKIHYPNLDLT